MPTTTPSSTPTDRTPRVAAIAIQKSNRLTRRSRRNSLTSIIPNTTASMMIAARTALGSSENTGASRISVAMTIAPVASDATGVLAPADSFSELAERLVETGIPWNDAGADVGHPLRHRLLVQVDAIAMPRGERLGVARRLREPDEQEREGRGDDLREVLRHDIDRRQLRQRQASRHRTRPTRPRRRPGPTGPRRPGRRPRARARRACVAGRSGARG